MKVLEFSSGDLKESLQFTYLSDASNRSTPLLK